jgi:2-phosphoglycerate kinase
MRSKRPEKILDHWALREELRHVYWIGGGSAAGKSTIAHRIAAQNHLHVYATDEVMSDHASRSTPEDAPALQEFMGMDMDERWVNRDPKTMLDTFHWFQGECFEMIVEDLLSLPKKPSVIVEGFRLLPELVHPLLAAPPHAVWFIPTPDFRYAVFQERGLGFLAKTSDPEMALRNLLERDEMFTEYLHEQTKRLPLRAITVETTMTEDDLARRTSKALGL